MSDDLFLRACRGEPVARTPVWMMRQAGRYLPEYRALRAKHDFLSLCRDPDLAAEVTVQPIDRLGVDAAILFADILLVPDAMGAGLRFARGEGPVFERPVRERGDLAGLRAPDVAVDLGYVGAALRRVRARLAGRGVPVIGFAGTPWTVAAYLVQGGMSKHYDRLLAWSWRDPDGLRDLLDRLADVTLEYLRMQIAAGAQAVQLFDTWGGLLDRARWDAVARPSLERILGALGDVVPRIYYGNGTGHLLQSLATLPIEVLSVDWRLPLDTVRAVVGPRLVLQGNLDPTVLLAPPATIEHEVARMLDAVADTPHIANLGHGILPTTPVEHAQAFVDAVARHSRRPVTAAP